MMISAASTTSLYHEIYGAGNPVLCIHGFGASLYTWRNFVEPLSKDHRLVLIDLKGSGKSPKPIDTKYSTQDHADLIYQFILDLDLKDLTLIGNSLGGALSLLVTIMLMEAGEAARLKSLVLIDTGAYKEYIPFYLRLLALPILDRIAHVLPSRFLANRVLRLAYYDASKVTEEQVSAYAAPLSAPGARHALLQTAKQLVPANFGDLVAKYKDIGVPTLIIWGKQDQIIPRRVGELLERDIPNSTLRVIDECGHAPQEEKPAETIALLLDFLNGRPLDERSS